MLVISKTIGEGISLSNEVKLTILGIHNNQVRLGIHTDSLSDVVLEDLKSNETQLPNIQDKDNHIINARDHVIYRLNKPNKEL
ncbi:carbon storage regulator [Legionella massiliensis]|uniref:Carbon storage regulator n=1 Tax=Legionella massiliensis TaxID=1034943 RepID=A0A078L5M7_9GAMM|nr:carbon storage regulator [Legionella massiliensis]CDZ79394.1 carbon storage regulator [Legionella massiliensis]CEE15132.1 Carbon storage regulator [Legionella massiliensis]